MYLQRWHGWCLHETAAVSAQVLVTPYNHAPCHIMQSHIRKVYACLAVTCHLHFWQNDQDLLHATAVTLEWNGYRNKSQHRKSTLEKKTLPAGIRTRDQSRVRRSNYWAIPAPLCAGWCHVALAPANIVSYVDGDSKTRLSVAPGHRTMQERLQWVCTCHKSRCTECKTTVEASLRFKTFIQNFRPSDGFVKSAWFLSGLS